MTWSCTYWLAPIMLRMRFAFSGTSMPSASSTARTEVSACTVVQTPQIRCVQIQASRGSRPRRISSIPRNIVPELQASVTAPLFTSASMRRWPSIRVTGSTTMRAITLLLCLLSQFFGRWGGPHSVADRAGDAMDNRCTSDRGRYPNADLPGSDVCSESRNIRQTFVKWRLRLPEVVASTPDTSMPRLDRPTGCVIEAHRRAVERCLRTFAPHLVEAPAAPVSLVAPLLHVATSVKMSTALALIMDDPSIRKERPIVLIDCRQLAEGQVMHQHSRCIHRILWASAQVDDFGLGHSFRNAHCAGGIRARRD